MQTIKPIDIYNEAQALIECQREHQRKAHEAMLSAEATLKDYRIKSVVKTLEEISDNLAMLDKKELHSYLVHCQNKLNGNIDGVEIDIKRAKGHSND